MLAHCAGFGLAMYPLTDSVGWASVYRL